MVEGRYDAAHLANIVDALILPVNGFSVFTNAETKDLLKTLGAMRGLLVLTDSDAAGFRIRHYIEKIAGTAVVKNAYIPQLKGKEKRKASPSKEGFLGVEGIEREMLLAAIKNACTPAPARLEGDITYTTLYTLGISGTGGAAEKRRAVLQSLGLPVRLSKKALIEVLNRLYSKSEFEALVKACK